MRVALFSEQLLCYGDYLPFRLSSIASLGFLFLAPVKIFSRRGDSAKVCLGGLGYSKLGISFLLSLLNVAQIATFLYTGHENMADLLSLGISFAASIALIWLSVVEHRTSPRPSTLIAAYLSFMIFENVLLNGATIMFPVQRRQFADVSVAAGDTLGRVLLLILESQAKVSLALLSPEKRRSPEDNASIFGRVFLWWLKDLLLVGKQRILQISDIPMLSSSLQPSRTRKNVLKAWDQRNKPETNLTLLRVLANCLTRQLLSPILPRLCVIVFRCSQPVLISQAILFVRESQGVEIDKCRAYRLFVAAVVVYLGLAISSSIYKQQLNKLEVVMRTSLVNLVYEKALHMNEGSDAGRVVTIMGTDIDSMCETGKLVHGTWAQFLELAIGMVLLAREVGWLFPVPLVIIFLCSRVSRFVAQNVRSRTKSWNDATQARISALSSVLGAMRSVKAMGISAVIEKHITRLRDKEIASSKHVRWMQAGYNASANANGIFTPVITVVLYAILAASRGEALDTKTAFTTVAILALVTHPANMIMTIVPQFVGILANVERIQSFLLERSRVDERKIGKNPNQDPEAEDEAAIRLKDVTVSFKDRPSPDLHNICLSLARNSITICAGPTGCGKTTLAKVMLGEIPPSQGIVEVSSSRIAYCDQRAWIPTGTIRDIICAFSGDIDERLYSNVLKACCIDYDLQRLPDGDDTVVGSRGVNLSGGQRQRIALARLLYSRADIAILDDPFSALDGATENRVVENMLGSDGWFKKAKITAFIISNSAQHFHLADQILLLDDGKVTIQGDWRSMQGRTAEIQKLVLGNLQLENPKPSANELDMKRARQNENAAEQDLKRSAGDFSLYGYYFRSVGVGNLAFFLLCTASYSIFNNFITYWFKLWTESDGTKVVFYIAGYIFLAFMAWLATSCQMCATYIFLASRSGHRLHEMLLQTTLAAPLLYFSTTDVGVILNRFSKDISLVDRQLPAALSALCTQICKMLVQLVILMEVQRLLLVTLPVCIIVVYLVQKLYLRTSRQLRVLELESHSALDSWYLETTEGITSIRAFNYIKASTDKNLENLELSIRPSYALESLQCWLNLVLDLLVSCIAIGVIFIAATWRSETSEANIGVSLNLILVANATLIRLVQSFTQLEVSLGAVSRLREIETQTPKEAKPWENEIPDSSWPKEGRLQLVDFSAGYSDEHKILSNIHLNVEAGQKLVICGRTGSGKSTTVLGLLRLIESTGTTQLDNHMLSKIPRHITRSRGFITVPQEPFFLPNASLSFNLDPESLASEDTLCQSLQKVGIWDALCRIISTDGGDPLSQPLSMMQTLSVGQLQLVSMARAIVRKTVLSHVLEFRDVVENTTSPKPILLLDEATSSLDPATESTIYDIVEREFVDEGYTVVIVAHRIRALRERMRRGRDQIAWLQDGRVVRVGDYEDIEQLATTAMDEEGD